MAAVETTRTIPAPPANVYAILADYREHHPRILPKPEFESLVVEQGGRGAGTVIRVGMRVAGARSSFRLTVEEPEPGRVLAETDESGARTTFTVESTEGGTSRVTIRTEWPPARGLGARLKAWVTARVARRIYERELANLAAYAPALAA